MSFRSKVTLVNFRSEITLTTSFIESSNAFDKPRDFCASRPFIDQLDMPVEIFLPVPSTISTDASALSSPVHCRLRRNGHCHRKARQS